MANGTPKANDGWAAVEQAVANQKFGDPAPDPQSIAAKRMKELVGQISDAAIEELRQLRDDIDHLIGAVQKRNETIAQAFDEHAALSVDVIKAKSIIKENIASITNSFQNGLPPIDKTITIGSQKS